MSNPDRAVLGQTINELVEKDPVVLRILGRYGIDTCCGGARTLEEAVRSGGLDPDKVAGEIASLLGNRPD